MSKLAECEDYLNAIQVPQLIKAIKLQGGHPDVYNGRPIMYTGGYCIVFPYMVDTRKYAIRCWHAYFDGAEKRTQCISEYLKQVSLPYFVHFEYVDKGIATPKGVLPIVIMEWVEAIPLKKFIVDNLARPDVLSRLAANFLQMAKDLHKHNISHGDLQHGNIMVKNDANIVLIDYDSMYVKALAHFPDEISGLKGYQHPARWKAKWMSPKSDYFSELVIYISLKALAIIPNLWVELQIEDTDTLVFSAEDIESKGTSPIFDRLGRYSELTELIRGIKSELNKVALDDLLPLEELCGPSLIDNLSNEWKDNGYKQRASQPVSYESEVKKTTQEWYSNAHASVSLPHSQIDVSDMRNEWNKT